VYFGVVVRKDNTVLIFNFFKTHRFVRVGITKSYLVKERVSFINWNEKDGVVECVYNDEAYWCNKVCNFKFRCAMEYEE
jgi:hypothetical protein